jgi:Leucine-rich repeat (LRR) protein
MDIPAPVTCILDDELIFSFLGREAPNELNIQGQNITEIDTALKKNYSSLRRLDISFNTMNSLEGVEQFPRLRELSAYCCRINNIGYIKEMSYLTSLMIQQNEITSIPPSFKSLKYLRELRVDRNQLTSIKNLSGCCCLRILDISFNKIDCLAELSGMQSLQELRANHNNIQSLDTLRSLPSIRELEVSHNKLRNLDGVQHLPTLEGIHAENNFIDTLKIPQTYTKQRNPSLRQDFECTDMMSSLGGLSRKTSLVNVGTLSRKPSMSNVGTLSRKTSMSSISAMSRKPSMSKMNMCMTLGSERSRSSSVDFLDFKDETVTVLGMRALTEVFLSHNQIVSMDGLDSLGTKLEVLDMRSNLLEFGGDKSSAMMESMSSLKRLKELKIGTMGDEKGVFELQMMLIGVCPMLRAIDGRVLSDEALPVREDLTKIDIAQDVDVNYDSNESEDDCETPDLPEIKRKVSLISTRKVSVSGSATALKEVAHIDDIPTMEVQFKTLLYNCKSTLAVMSIKELGDTPIRKAPVNCAIELRKSTSSVYSTKKASAYSKVTENVKQRGTANYKSRKNSSDSATKSEEKPAKSTTKRDTKRIGSVPNLSLPPTELKGRSPELM